MWGIEEVERGAHSKESRVPHGAAVLFVPFDVRRARRVGEDPADLSKKERAARRAGDLAQ